MKASGEYTSAGAREVVKGLVAFVAAQPNPTLSALLAKHALPYAHVTKAGVVKCPSCKAIVDDSFKYIEDIGCGRSVVEQEDKTIKVDGYYETEGFDEGGEAERFSCGACDTEFVLPDGVEIEWL